MTDDTTPSDPLQALEELAARIAKRAEHGRGWELDRKIFQAELAELAAALEARRG
jgi:hypothetical protein